MGPLAPLPHPVGDTLPLFGYPLVRWWQVLLAATLALIAWRWLTRKPPPVPASRPRAQPPEPTPTRAATVDWLDALEAEIVASARYREGCDKLDHGVRVRLTALLGDLETLTARELGPLFEDDDVGNFARRVRDLRFARAKPTAAEFRALCKEARALLRRAPKPRRTP